MQKIHGWLVCSVLGGEETQWRTLSLLVKREEGMVLKVSAWKHGPACLSLWRNLLLSLVPAVRVMLDKAIGVMGQGCGESKVHVRVLRIKKEQSRNTYSVGKFWAVSLHFEPGKNYSKYGVSNRDHTFSGRHSKVTACRVSAAAHVFFQQTNMVLKELHSCHPKHILPEKPHWGTGFS